MKKRLARVVLVFALILVSVPALSGQAAAPAALPAPYAADEFPEWARGLRRFEVISIGVFPVLLFYTRAGFDLYRYTTNGFESQYLPWPFKSEYSYRPETSVYNREQLQAVLIAGLLSLAFAGTDALIRWSPSGSED